MMSNTAILHRPEAYRPEKMITIERERLIDERDALVEEVRTRKLERQTSLERWINHRRGSAKAIRQTIAAIRHGENQIFLIDLQLQSIGTR